MEETAGFIFSEAAEEEDHISGRQGSNQGVSHVTALEGESERITHHSVGKAIDGWQEIRDDNAYI